MSSEKKMMSRFRKLLADGFGVELELKHGELEVIIMKNTNIGRCRTTNKRDIELALNKAYADYSNDLANESNEEK